MRPMNLTLILTIIDMFPHMYTDLFFVNGVHERYHFVHYFQMVFQMSIQFPNKYCFLTNMFLKSETKTKYQSKNHMHVL